MIVKKIPAMRDSRHTGSGRAKHVRDLVDYMRSPDKENPLRDHLIAYMASQGHEGGPERLIHIGARNFVCDDLEGQRAEMMAVAQAAVRSPNPIDHWLLSWREGDIPTNEEVDEAIGIFVDDLGLGRHQCIYAVHGDTHNRHVHIALNRYNQGTGKVITIEKGFYREASHKSVARIVQRFGWQAEANARYAIVDGRPELSQAAKDKVAEGKRPLRAGAAECEVRTGFRSAQRIAQEEALPILLGAKSWPALHVALANRGIRYQAVGTNGALLIVGEERVKSSDISRQATIGRLEKRLGPFRPRDPGLAIADRLNMGDRFPEAFRAEEFQADRRLWNSTSKAERKHLGLEQPPTDLETWLHKKEERWFAECWRKRNLPLDDLLSFNGAEKPAGKLPAEIDGYRAFPCKEGMRYARDGEGTAFIDRGEKVSVLPGSDDALVAALRLAIIKYDGKVHVSGTDAMKQRTFELAQKYGLAHHLTNPEFALRQEMERRNARVGTVPISKPPPMQPIKRSTGNIIEQAAALQEKSNIKNRLEGAEALRRLAKGPYKPELPLLDPRNKGRGR